MKHLLIVLLSSLVVTQAQLIPGFGFDLDGRGGFSFSNPLFNGSFTPNSLQNSVDRFSRVASDIGNRVRNVARLVPTPPTVANPISNIFSRFGRGDSNVNSNSNANQNSNVNVGDHIHRAIDSVRSGIGNAINRIPQIPPIPQIPDLGSFVSDFENLWKPIQNLISNPSQQFPVRPDQIFNRINQFLPGVSQAMKSFADFSKTALRSDFWSKIPGAVQRRIQNQIQSVRSDIENMSTAMKDMMQTMPDFTFGAGLNSTLRNQPFFFPNRSGIVHLFEWKFDDIAEECEKVLGPNGYGGVQVSPVNEYLVSAKRAWWERYQPISYEIKSRSGDEKQFSNMVKRCLKAGVRIYVDVIANHMAAPGASIPVYGTAGSTSDPAAREFPSVPFNKSHFHADCVINNYKDAANVRNCQLSSLPDLDQSNSYVREKIVNYLNRLIDLGVAGFRMDACKHMSPEDLKAIYDSLKPLNPRYFYPPMARPFIYQEVIDLGTEAVKATEYTNLGVVTEFQWGLALGEIFKGNIPTETLAVLTKDGAGDVFLPSSQALVFVDNHDNQRGHGAGGDSILTYKSKQKYIQAVAFTLATDYGIARVMSSYDFADSDQGPPQDSMQIITSPGTADDGSCTNGWVCEHRWPEIRRMISFKNYVAGTTLDHIQSANNTFALCRGEKGFMAINNSEETVTKTFHTCLPEGKYCDIISGEPSQGTCSGTVINVGANGDATITLQKNSVVAIYLLSKIS